MTGNELPAFVSNVDHLAQYRIEDASPANPGDGKTNTSPWSERFIHSEIYKRYPDVQSVVHSHSRDVITVGVSAASMKPIYHMAGFLGQHVPTFDAANFYEGDMAHNLLVNSNKLGADLASTLSSPAQSETISTSTPDYTVTLQRGHGFTTWGTNVQEAVYRAVYAQENARIQIAAQSSSDATEQTIKSLSPQEIKDCGVMNKASVNKAWAYWSRIVSSNPMYKNELLGVRDVKKERDYWSRTEGRTIAKKE